MIKTGKCVFRLDLPPINDNISPREYLKWNIRIRECRKTYIRYIPSQPQTQLRKFQIFEHVDHFIFYRFSKNR